MLSWLLRAPYVAIAVDTRDPNCATLGSGVFRNDACLLGVALAAQGKAVYLDAIQLPLLRDALPRLQALIGHNLLYTLDWLCNKHAISPPAQLHDVAFAAALLDEYKDSYSLDALDPLLPSRPTPQAKALSILKLFESQEKSLHAQKLLDVYNLECSLIPMYVYMRKHGVLIDMPALKTLAQQTIDTLQRVEANILATLGPVNLNSSQQLAVALAKNNIHAPTPRLDKGTLETLAKEHPVARDLLTWRKCNTTAKLFLAPYLAMACNSRLHPTYYPLPDGKHGTVSGRISMALPNLQQVTDHRDLRSLFRPEPSQVWASLDYSQIEYRIIAHYATGPGANELRKSYNDNPLIDYHNYIANLINRPRKTAKAVNFGTAYYMGPDAAAQTFGWSRQEAQKYMQLLHSHAPYLAHSRTQTLRQAQKDGYIVTLSGRRARLHHSRPDYAIFNRLIQGTAADILKIAMLKSWQAGLYQVLTPHICIHDELDVSAPNNREGQEALDMLTTIMAHCVRLSVPLHVTQATGPNWADATLNKRGNP